MIWKLSRYYVLGILTNRNLWFWGIGFMLFFLVVGAFEFGQNVPAGISLQYTSGWYATITLFSLSSLAISIAYVAYYASHSLAYSFRYTRLTPSGYILSVIAGSLILGVFMNVVMLIGTVGIFGIRFGKFIAPNYVLSSLIISAGAGVFMMGLAFFLVLLVVNYLGLKNVNLVSFVPLILSYAFGFAQIGTTLPDWLIYASPYNALVSLLYNSFSGEQMLFNPSSSSATMLDLRYLSLSVLAWTVLLLAVNTVLLRSIRPREIEEARQI